MGWYITEQLHILNTEHYLDNKMLSLQPVERIAFILRNKFKFAMQAWQIYYIQTHRMYLSIRHTHTHTPPHLPISQSCSFFMASFPQSMKQSYYTKPLNYKRSKSVLFQKRLSQGLN